ESQEDSPMSIVKSTSPMSIGSFSGNEVVEDFLENVDSYIIKEERVHFVQSVRIRAQVVLE
ncbi:hypothetical protein QYM36_011057, partial [Artemia franciscana]